MYCTRYCVYFIKRLLVTARKCLLIWCSTTNSLQKTLSRSRNKPQNAKVTFHLGTIYFDEEHTPARTNGIENSCPVLSQKNVGFYSDMSEHWTQMIRGRKMTFIRKTRGDTNPLALPSDLSLTIKVIIELSFCWGNYTWVKSFVFRWLTIGLSQLCREGREGVHKKVASSQWPTRKFSHKINVQNYLRPSPL